MKSISFKRILPLALAIVMTVASLASLTSCLTFIGGGYGGEGSSEGTDGGSDAGNSGASGGESDGTGDSADGGSQAPEFLPREEGAADSVDLTSSSKALLSVVRIVSNYERKSSYSSTTTPFISEGSGVIYKLDRSAGDAYIITNYHVVYNSESITPDKISDEIDLYLYGQEDEKYKISATYVGGSMTQDLAVLRVEDSEVLKNSYALAATVGNSEALRPLDNVIVVGNPDGLGISVTSGIVSVDSEYLAMIGADGKTAIELRVTRVSAAVNTGNSGGGLFDSQGNLVGIVNAKRIGESYKEDIDNIGYALPINAAKTVADAIIHYCDGESTTLYRCLLGINLNAAVMGITVDPETGVITKVERVEIAGITAGCVLEGQVAVGDIINSITVDGAKTDVTRTYHVIDAMYNARVGSTVSLNLTRGDIDLTVEVTIPEGSLTEVE